MKRAPKKPATKRAPKRKPDLAPAPVAAVAPERAPVLGEQPPPIADANGNVYFPPAPVLS